MKNKTILITGGTGSLGQHLVKRILKKKPRKVIVYSRGELLQVEMRRKYPREKESRLRLFVGDIRDKDRLEMAFRGVDIVIHCAALKHVDVCEYNSSEAVKTNVIGTQNIIEVAIKQGVDRVLSVSSDKAVNPANLYGATKLCADKLIENADSYAGKDGTKFATIRFGNFWGSSGSVVPFFEERKAEGKEYLPITDYRMTRFFIQPDEAVTRIFEALKIMEGGEIFCPKMKSMTIKDVAVKIAPKMKTREVGVKKGEKLHEEMLTSAEIAQTFARKNFYIVYRNGGGMGKRVSPNFVYSSENHLEGDGYNEKI
jgi:FlaA1/EpsC-like NDP-sugar epimerase